MALQPFFRSPLTDLTACLVNHQSYSKCAQFEMDMTECMEAYGLELGTKRCKDLIDDFHECTTFDKQTFRIFVSINLNSFY